MRCPHDNGRVDVTHVYVVEGTHKTQSGVCVVCGRKFTIVAEMFPQEAKGHASTVARQMRKKKGAATETHREPCRPETA